MTEVDARDLRTGLGAVMGAVARDPARPILQTVCIEQLEEGKLRLAAADNYQLAVYDVICASGGDMFPRIALPLREVRLLRNFLRDVITEVTLSVTDGLLRVSMSHGAIELWLMDGPYPNYAHVLRPEITPSVTLNLDLIARVIDGLRRGGAQMVGVGIVGPLDPVVFRAMGGHVVTVMPLRLVSWQDRTNRLPGTQGHTGDAGPTEGGAS